MKVLEKMHIGSNQIPTFTRADTNHQASFALECLKAEEQQTAGKYRRVEDKKMCLGSYLLKYLVVARTCGVPWSDIQIVGGEYKKPCYRPTHSSSPGVEFNISHQAGLVGAVAYPGTSTKVGVDIVCVNERNDLARIDEKGFDAWVDMFEEMFSDRELNDIKYSINAIQLEDGTEISADQLGDLAHSCSRHEPMGVVLASGESKYFSSGVIVEAKLRRFYAFWCLKEAYIKMSGEALLAEWLRHLEFRNVCAPKPNPGQGKTPGNRFGEVVRGVEVLFKGKVVNDVNIELQAFEEQYMIATAISPTTPDGPKMQGVFPDFEIVDLERDIYPWAPT
jgi:4'-phosphopantetheinyl transferase